MTPSHNERVLAAPPEGLGAAGELSRSPAAAAVALMAESVGLRQFHFDHRVRLETPDGWRANDRSDLADAPAWQAGRLPEAKYGSFRHDLALASFHPSHHPKWAGHELCHGLVGCAWWPGMSGLELALAARLAEGLPVALYYLLDEAGLRRCHDHAGGGPLWKARCPECERAASGQGDGTVQPMQPWLDEGAAFVARELEAVRRSVREGRPVPNRLATLDLASDGMAYALAHGARLRSPTMHRFAEHFWSGANAEGAGRVGSLEALAARVEALTSAIVVAARTARAPSDRAPGADFEALRRTMPAQTSPSEAGRVRWMAQDLGMRLLEVQALVDEPDSEVSRELDRLVEALAEGTDVEALATACAGYEALADDWVLPPADEVLAVGYALPGGRGSSLAQLDEGLASAMPSGWPALRAQDPGRLARFAQDERQDEAWRREPLGARFVRFLEADDAPAPLRSLAAYEQAVVEAPAPSDVARLLAPLTDGSEAARALVLAERARVLDLSHDALAVEAAVHGEGPMPQETPAQADGLRFVLVAAPTADGGVAALPLAPDVPERAAWLALSRASPDGLDGAALAAHGLAPDAVGAAIREGLLHPRRW